MRNTTAISIDGDQHLAASLAEQGYVLIRGMSGGLEGFSQLVRRMSSRITLDPARELSTDGVAQKVDAGTAAMGLHLENGNSPFPSELTWFYCERAAEIGSQTTVCDGCRVWQAMSAPARAYFTRAPLLYRRRVEALRWKTFVRHRAAVPKATDDIVFKDLLALVEDPRSARFELHEDESITYEYRIPAVRTSLFGGRMAWANSIFGPSYNYEKPTITFADGAEIDQHVLLEMKKLTDELTSDLEWQNGDVVVIDNTRVMHGRREIRDARRLIYNAQSFIKPEILEEVPSERNQHPDQSR